MLITANGRIWNKEIVNWSKVNETVFQVVRLDHLLFVERHHLSLKVGEVRIGWLHWFSGNLGSQGSIVRSSQMNIGTQWN